MGDSVTTGSGAAEEAAPFTREELQLAVRNHGMPLEALRWNVTPVGMHYLLSHYDIPLVDARGWSLGIGGMVAEERSLTLDELRRRPRTSMAVTMECAGNGRALQAPRPVSQPWLLEGVGTGEWTGALLAPLLAEVDVAPGVVEAVFSGLDRGVEGGQVQHYERSLPLAELVDGPALLAYELNGAPLPPQHGFPLRLVVPGWYGMTNVKWLRRITFVDRPFTGFQMTEAYRMRTGGREVDAGEPLSRMRPRALMVPPGIPDFLTRRRLLRPGAVVVEGRAWSGQGPVTAVEVTTDGGQQWQRAELGEGMGRWAWRAWSYEWAATEGDHVLSCRATDATGDSQPVEAVWNYGGYANNVVQRVHVTVGGGW